MLGDTEPGEKRRVLGHEADATELSRIAGWRTTQYFDRARRRSEETDGEIEQGGFPRSVRSHQSDNVTRRDLEAAIGERRLTSVTLSEAACLDDGAHATPS
jgi:hypothetical protein